MDLTKLILESALEEANNFQELPAAWKKHVVNQNGGKDSNVETIVSKGKIKNTDGFRSTIKKTIAGARSFLIAWVEFDGKEIMAVHSKTALTSNKLEYSVIMADGAMKEIERREKRYGTGKWDRRADKYIPTSYRKYKDKALTPTEAVDIMMDSFLEMAVVAKFGAAATVGSVGYTQAEEALTELVSGAGVVIKGIEVDQNRVAIRADRKDAKDGINTADQKDKRAVIKKLVVAKVDAIRKKMEAAVPDISKIDAMIDKAVGGNFDSRKDGFKAGDLSDLENLLSELNGILSNAAYVGHTTDYLGRKSKITFKDRSWGTDKVSASNAAKRLLGKE